MPSFANTLRKMPFDRARAEEQLGGDFGVGLPVAGEFRDLHLLRSELVPRLGLAFLG